MSRAFRTNIVRRILAFALVALAFNFACTTSTPAQSNKDAERIQKVGRDINKIGIGEKVWVKTLDGAKLKGHINEIGADYVVAQQTNSAWLTDNDRAKLESLRAAGFEALFNLDYEAARKNFREIAESLPNHPAGPQFLAASLWIETLYQSRRLQSSLYDSDSFYSQNR